MNRMDAGFAEAVGNPFARALQAGQPLIGVWSMLNSFNVTEGLSLAGYDWLLVDGEHSPVTLADAMMHLRILAATRTVPIVRLPWNDPILLKQYLDAGARTVMLPYVQSVDEAREAVQAMHYPPRGRRGVAAMHRASRFGFDPDYLAHASDTLFLIVQAETRLALDRVGEIAAVDGVDAVFFGPGDLAASMGKIGKAGDADVTAAIDAAAAEVRAAGKAVGVMSANAELAERHLRNGYDFVAVSNDAAMVFQAARSASQHFRSIAEQHKIRKGA